MPEIGQSSASRHTPPTLHPRLFLIPILCLASLFVTGRTALPARAAGNTWYVTTVSDDALDGNLVTKSGSLRFTLSNAISGDFVSMARRDTAVDVIDVYSTLFVPNGVAVGQTRDVSCGSVFTPLVTIRGNAPITTVFSLGAGATLRNMVVSNGKISAKATGANVDVCGMGLGYIYNSTDGLVSAPPTSAAFVADAPGARLHSSAVSNTVIVTEFGSDTIIGDTPTGAGDADIGTCGNGSLCSVSVLSGTTGAAQRVTIRDSFSRGLLGLAGIGIAGGDDVITHTNNWVETPAIHSAYTLAHYYSLVVKGTASPRSLIDIYSNDGISVTRQTQAPIVADASGTFTFTGALQGITSTVYAVSTLYDLNHQNRMGSSSQWSGIVQVADLSLRAILWLPVINH